MKQVKFSILAGLSFGIVDVLIMIPIEMADKGIAMLGAFAGRFAIGFLIPNTKLPVKPWMKGVIVGTLVSLPDAIITGAFAPVIGTGILGGAIIGYFSGKRH